jgi:hypothetical protein
MLDTCSLWLCRAGPTSSIIRSRKVLHQWASSSLAVPVVVALVRGLVVASTVLVVVQVGHRGMVRLLLGQAKLPGPAALVAWGLTQLATMQLPATIRVTVVLLVMVADNTTATVVQGMAMQGQGLGMGQVPR